MRKFEIFLCAFKSAANMSSCNTVPIKRLTPCYVMMKKFIRSTFKKREVTGGKNLKLATQSLI